METIFEPKTAPGKFDRFLGEDSDSVDFPLILQFPKEFQRNWFKQFDLRFMLILLATLIFEVCALLFFLSWVTAKNNSIDINLIQKQYANLLLDKGSKNKLAGSEETHGTHLYGVPETTKRGESTLEDQSSLASGSNDQSGNRPGRSGKTRSVNRYRAGGDNGQPASHQTFYDQTSGSSDWINSKGILQYIITADNKGTNEELSEILTQGNRQARILESSLAKVKLSKFSPTGHQGTMIESSEGGEGTIPGSGLKGAKSGITKVEARSTVTPLEKAEYTTVAKNTELENFSLSVIEKTGTKASARQADYVNKVVLSHNRSIQDCFKQALKNRPELRGKVVVRFSVTPEGWVDQVSILQTTIDYEPMLTCIINRIRNWKDFGESDPTLGIVSYRQTYVFGY